MSAPTRRRPVAGLILVALLALAGCSAHAGATSSAATGTGVSSAAVTVAGQSFSPSSVTIQAGGTVTWTWSGGGRGPGHDVHLDDGGVSPLQSQGSWSHTFTTAGTYRYHCDIHRMMTATVTVT
jgi:plastocyanin